MQTHSDTDAHAITPDTPVTVLDLAPRIHSSLIDGGIYTVDELTSRSASSLLTLPGLGHGAISALRLELLRHGLTLHGDEHMRQRLRSNALGSRGKR